MKKLSSSRFKKKHKSRFGADPSKRNQEDEEEFGQERPEGGQTIAFIPKSDQLESNEIFIILIIAIVFGWIIVSLITRVIENIYFETFGFSEFSTFHSIIMAASIFIIFVAFIIMIKAYRVIPGIETGIVPGFAL